MWKSSVRANQRNTSIRWSVDRCAVARFLTMAAVRSQTFTIVGEVFGLEHDEEHHFSAEAVNDTIILVVSAVPSLGLRRATPTSLASSEHDRPRTPACSEPHARSGLFER
jgi:hypothetical protein